MADLKNMTGTEAFQLAKDESALTTDEIAERLNVSPSVIKRYLKSGDSYLPGLEMAPTAVRSARKYDSSPMVGSTSRIRGRVCPSGPKPGGSIDVRGPRWGCAWRCATDSCRVKGDCPSPCP